MGKLQNSSTKLHRIWNNDVKIVYDKQNIVTKLYISHIFIHIKDL
ncbi:hypothetical protein HCCG_01262 [Helicobacter cinaedi CCUG 18818 = ATCC BAA-847]|uniref:Uncharacterized protein n=1 Tax=Helicobacter cinaedi CCUG 18818 = ATCC BAA-847 TaxID=537971 RepID=A0ABN0BC32_9HELI|nr:hypothetical protein HCCG_01262 [Helicobacter cinaedi CCUG 18818 = ATCC BAA-847]BBB19927.1 hypothetical protein HC081234_11040 [Helicobacter cinaedi]